MNSYNNICRGGRVYRPFLQLLEQNHILIAGTTGSGKSVLLNGLIKTLMGAYSPIEKSIVLIDLKKVELYQFSKSRYCIGYSDNYNTTEIIFSRLTEIMHNRFFEMRRKGCLSYNGTDIYIVIDEYADISLNCSKQTINNIALIATQGRAAGIHLIIATQRPTRDIITPLLKCNCDTKIALRTATIQESRNIINSTEAAFLPRYGKALIQLPGFNPEITDIPMI